MYSLWFTVACRHFVDPAFSCHCYLVTLVLLYLAATFYFLTSCPYIHKVILRLVPSIDVNNLINNAASNMSVHWNKINRAFMDFISETQDAHRNLKSNLILTKNVSRLGNYNLICEAQQHIYIHIYIYIYTLPIHIQCMYIHVCTVYHLLHVHLYRSVHHRP